jgi:acyl-CoA reductase-like NAD-dependent aldehyde dehydrogenase
MEKVATETKTEQKELQEEKTNTFFRKHPVTQEPIEYEKRLVTRKVRKKLDKSQKEAFKTIMEIDQVLQNLNNEILSNSDDDSILELLEAKKNLKSAKQKLYRTYRSDVSKSKENERALLVERLKDLKLIIEKE